jgi:septal ring factor EnvC (AmiA/AmiB activator)
MKKTLDQQLAQLDKEIKQLQKEIKQLENTYKPKPKTTNTPDSDKPKKRRQHKKLSHHYPACLNRSKRLTAPLMNRIISMSCSPYVVRVL